MRKTVIAVGLAFGLFFIVRAIAEPFVIDMSKPATYRDDWGGPSLLGVLLVHCGPGVLAAVGIATVLIRHRSSGRGLRPARQAPPRLPVLHEVQDATCNRARVLAGGLATPGQHRPGHRHRFDVLDVDMTLDGKRQALSSPVGG